MTDKDKEKCISLARGNYWLMTDKGLKRCTSLVRGNYWLLTDTGKKRCDIWASGNYQLMTEKVRRGVPAMHVGSTGWRQILAERGERSGQVVSTG